jgi:hypothetical protein
MIESPIAASILQTGHDPRAKQYEFSGERDDFKLAKVNLTHNMQEQVELYQDVIQFEKLAGPKEKPLEVLRQESSADGIVAQNIASLNGYASAYFGGSGNKPVA